MAKALQLPDSYGLYIRYFGQTFSTLPRSVRFRVVIVCWWWLEVVVGGVGGGGW